MAFSCLSLLLSAGNVILGLVPAPVQAISTIQIGKDKLPPQTPTSILCPYQPFFDSDSSRVGVLPLAVDSAGFRCGTLFSEPPTRPSVGASENIPEGAFFRLGSLKLRHPGGIQRFAFYTDSKRLATLGIDGILRVWNISKGTQEFHLALAAKTSVFAVANRAETVATSGFDGKIHLWDAIARKPVRTLVRHGTSVAAVAFSHDDTLLVSGDDRGRVILWDTQTFKPTLEIDNKAGVSCLSISQDASKVAIGGTDGSVSAWDTKTGALVRRVLPFSDPRAVVTCIAWFSDSKSILAGTNADSAIIEPTVETQPIKLSQPSVCGACAPFRHGFVLGGNESPLTLFDKSDFDAKRMLPNSLDCKQVSYSPDGATLAAVSGPAMLLWEVETAKPKFAAAPTIIRAAFPSLDSKQVLIHTGQQRLELWDTTTQKKVQSFQDLGRPSRAVALTADARAFVENDDDFGYVRELATAKLQFRLDGFNNCSRISQSPNGRLLAAGNKIGITVWDLKSRKAIHNFASDGIRLGFGSFSFSSDSNLLIATGGGNTLRAWNLATGQLAWNWALDKNLSPLRVPRVHCINSSDLIVTAEGGRGTTCWDLPSKKRVFSAAQATSEIDCSFDGRLLATVSEDHSVEVWEIASGTLIARYGGHEGACTIHFARDCKSLISAGDDGTIVGWDLWTLSKPPFGGKSVFSPANSAALWDQLLQAEATKAHSALCTFIKTGDDSVSFLSTKLTPSDPITLTPIPDLIVDLSSDAFPKRDAAYNALKKLGRFAESQLLAALKQNPSKEAQTRIKLLLENLPNHPCAGEDLRNTRAIQILELIASPPAMSLLRRLAKGSQQALLTQQSAAALDRLSTN